MRVLNLGRKSIFSRVWLFSWLLIGCWFDYAARLHGLDLHDARIPNAEPNVLVKGNRPR